MKRKKKFQNDSNACEIFDNLGNWIENTNWKSYDVCDIKAHQLFLGLQEVRSKWNYGKYFTHPFFIFEERFAPFLRKILRIKKNIYSQALALMAIGYLRAYGKTNNKKYFEKSIKCLTWLESNPIPGYSSICWGQPYDWYSRKLISKNTPRATVTSLAITAFLDAYELTKDKQYLSIVEDACNFFINDLNQDQDEDGHICFSYTTNDHFHVHNANMLVAAALVRTSHYTKNSRFLDMGSKALNYSMKHQNSDGSWYYWGPPDKIQNKIDNYHTGFILESLQIIKRYSKKAFLYSTEMKKGIEFYCKNLFSKGIIPKMTSDSLYPIDIQSCAQSIITLSEFESDFVKNSTNIFNIFKWTVQNMYDSKGYFYYRIYNGGWIDKTPYLRWGESWMLRALSYLI